MKRVKLFEDFEDFDDSKTELYSIINEEKLRKDFIATVYENLSGEFEDVEDTDTDIWNMIADYGTYLQNNIISYLEENKNELVLEVLERHPDLIISKYNWFNEMIKLPNWAKRSKKTGLLDMKGGED